MIERSGQIHRPGSQRIVACLVAVLGLMALSVAPAEATTLERFHVTQSYAYQTWDCGYAMDVAGVAMDTVVVRADPNLDGNVFVTDAYQYTETWTVADGRSLTLEATGLSKDVRAKSLGGSVYEFTYHNAGQPATIIDSSGIVVSRDRGNLSFTYTIDLADGTFTLVDVRIAGPHPSWPDLCRDAAPLIGTDSARYLTPRPIGSTSFPMGFYEYLPPSYSTAGAKSPLLVALNGYGENGDGTPDALVNLLNTGIPRFIDIGGWPTERPLVVLALQHVEEAPVIENASCDGAPWFGSCIMLLQAARNDAPPNSCTTPDEIHDFIAYALAHYNVDPARVYVTGLSCGGYGAWAYVAKYGDAQVAAAVPIAADGRPAWASVGCGLGAVPIWAFHSGDDDIVNPLGSVVPIDGLRGCGVPTERADLTVYDLGLGHGGWDEAYSGSQGQDIYTWMLGFSKP
jgi:hypothetical protein